MKVYYGIQRTPEYLEHYGVKGMKWGKHLFGRFRMMSNQKVAETDTGTGTNHSQESVIDRLRNQDKDREDRWAKAAAANAAVREEKRKEAEAAEAEKAAKKAKKSSGSKKKASKTTNDDASETENETAAETNQNGDELPSSLVEKLKDRSYKMTADEIKTRATVGTKKAKELLDTLPENPTLEDIDKLWDKESDQMGVGYDAFTIELADFTARIKFYTKQIESLTQSIIDSKSIEQQEELQKQIEKATEDKEFYEWSLRENLKTGESRV